MIGHYSSIQNFTSYKEQLDKYFELNYGLALPPREQSMVVGSGSATVLRTESRKLTLPMLAPSPVKTKDAMRLTLDRTGTLDAFGDLI